ncbi:MAG: hypothetical protein COB02_16500 [Candidatus Cloacimonadota bacterium]|nr:MAG: hypothetical protein COB02_16500 [Candidatus Cloacimonadota bacterium]
MRLYLLLFIILLTSTFSKARHVVNFSPSVAKQFGFDMTRFNEVAAQIHFGSPSLLNQWSIINASAEATYNDILNILEVKKELYIFKNGKGTLMSLNQLKKKYQYAYTVKVDTIFHEMAHAEMDKFIEEGKTPQDKKLYNVLKNEVKPWIKRNSKRSSSIGIFELHGYFIGQIIETMFADIGDIYLFNGINIYQSKFFAGRNIKKKATELSLEEFIKLLIPKRRAKKLYRDRIEVGYVWVKGKEIELKGSSKDPFKKEWFQAIWDHFEYFYNPPTNIQELTQHLAKDFPLKEKLIEYRKKLHEEQNKQEDSQDQDLFNDLNQE